MGLVRNEQTTMLIIKSFVHSRTSFDDHRMSSHLAQHHLKTLFSIFEFVFHLFSKSSRVSHSILCQFSMLLLQATKQEVGYTVVEGVTVSVATPEGVVPQGTCLQASRTRPLKIQVPGLPNLPDRALVVGAWCPEEDTSYHREFNLVIQISNKHKHMTSMKLVILLHFISWKTSFSDISRKHILPNHIW